MYDKKLLTKNLIIEAYKEKFPNNYKEQKNFKFIIKFLEEFSDMTISAGFPDFLLTDNFDLMLEIFIEYDYINMSIEDIDKLARFIVVNKNKYNNYIENMIYSISTYCPKDILEKLTKQIEKVIEDLSKEFKDKIIKSIKNEQ